MKKEISTEKENKIKQLEFSLSAIEKEKESKMATRDKLMHSKAYKAWQLYNGIKKIFIKDNNLLSNSLPQKSNYEDYQFTPLNKDKFIDDIIMNSRNKSNQYIPKDNKFYDFSTNDLKYIAFYLPQYHPIEENNRWWGNGFTEWTNVSKAIPQFVGHYQPHLPDELGFYDLRIPEIMEQQIELAKKYGIFGFCFYYYWFSGKRLLEKPLDMFIKNKKLNQPFCLCWANENWTRRWDGLNNEILIGQDYTKEDEKKFVTDLKKYINDYRYIRINNKPLIVIYRPGLIPNIKNTISNWRKNFKKEGIGEVYLVTVKAFGFENYKEIGFDMGLDFFPHNMEGCRDITNQFEYVNPNFSGNIFDLKSYVKNKKYLELNKNIALKCISPGWDNSPRKANGGTVYYNATPRLYQEWLSDLSKFTKQNFQKEEQIVFINAWNEWAEGAHLEPDKKFGFGYLEATRNVLNETNRKKILYVCHDACYNGAQICSLNIIKQLSENFKYDVSIILLSGGPLETQFSQYGKVYNLEKDYSNNEKLNQLLVSLYNSKINKALCNTVVTGKIIPLLKENGFKIVVSIHEMPNLIKTNKLENSAQNIYKYADKIIFASKIVEQKFFKEIINKDIPNKSIIRPQGLYKFNDYKDNIQKAREKLRKLLNIPKESLIVLGVGFGDYRKGLDIFVETSKIINQKKSQVHFIWVGETESNLYNSLKKDIFKNKNLHFVGKTDDVGLYYAASDLYLLTSREDPFPSVVIESFDVGIPVVGFKDAGGFSDIITKDTGILVDYLDINKLITAILFLLNNQNKNKELGVNCKKIIQEKFNFTNYIFDLLGFIGEKYKKVSVVIPNYNYEKYLTSRINSVLSQNYPLLEIIILDDKSKDNSIDVIKDFQQKNPSLIKIILNKENSGSVFKQWSKGINESKGDYIWIAEADDLSKDNFIDSLIKNFKKNTILAYTQSNQIDQNGNLIANNYLDYTNDIDSQKWLKNYYNDGIAEIKDILSIKNTIPNVSATIFRKTNLAPIINKLLSFKVAGDWYFYVYLLQKGNIYFEHQSLNYHRRHLNSVTVDVNNNKKHFSEIIEMQDYINNIFSVETKTRKKAINYRKIVKEYLNIKD